MEKKNIACKSFIDFGGSSIKSRRGQMFFSFSFLSFSSTTAKTFDEGRFSRNRRERETDRQTDRQTGRESKKKVYREGAISFLFSLYQASIKRKKNVL